MVTDEQKRQAIRKAYDSDDWRKKVDRMGWDQIHAIYLRFKSQNRL